MGTETRENQVKKPVFEAILDRIEKSLIEVADIFASDNTLEYHMIALRIYEKTLESMIIPAPEKEEMLKRLESLKGIYCRSARSDTAQIFQAIMEAVKS